MTASQIAHDISVALGTNLILFVVILIACLVSLRSKIAGIVIYSIGVLFQVLSILGQAKSLRYYKTYDHYLYEYYERNFSLALFFSIVFAVVGIVIIAHVIKKTNSKKQSTESNNLNEQDSFAIKEATRDIPTIDCGTNMSNPIYVQGENGLTRYLSSLRTIRNEGVTWELLSTYPVKDIGSVRAYKVSTARGFYATLYFNISGNNNPSFAPKGFVFNSMKVQTIAIDHINLVSANSETTATFCRKCGAQLVDGYAFCRKCGTPVVMSLVESEQKTTEVDETENLDPPKPKLVAPKEKDNEQSNSLSTDIDFLDSNLPPKIRRAFLFIEDGEWEKADSYLESALDEEPMNAYAYLEKLMVELKIKKTSDLMSSTADLSENKNYLKALRFADKDLKDKLNTLKQPGVNIIKKQSTSRQPIMTKGGMIWVDRETAKKIATGEIDLNKPVDPEKMQEVLNAALSLMHWDEDKKQSMTPRSVSSESNSNPASLQKENKALNEEKIEKSVPETDLDSIHRAIDGKDRIDKLSYLSEALDDGRINFDDYRLITEQIDADLQEETIRADTKQHSQPEVKQSNNTGAVRINKEERMEQLLASVENGDMSLDEFREIIIRENL